MFTCVNIDGFKKLVAYHRANQKKPFESRFDFLLHRIPEMGSYPPSCPVLSKQVVFVLLDANKNIIMDKQNEPITSSHYFLLTLDKMFVSVEGKCYDQNFKYLKTVSRDEYCQMTGERLGIGLFSILNIRVSQVEVILMRWKGREYIKPVAQNSLAYFLRCNLFIPTNGLYLYPDFSDTGIPVSYTEENGCFEWALLRQWSPQQFCVVNTLNKTKRFIYERLQYDIHTFLFISSTGSVYGMNRGEEDGSLNLQNVEDSEDWFDIQLQGLDVATFPHQSHQVSRISKKYFVYANTMAEQVEFYSRKTGKLIIVLDVWANPNRKLDEVCMNYRDDGLLCFKSSSRLVKMSEIPLLEYEYFDVNSMMKERILELGHVFNSNVLRSIAKHLFL